jgi:hypothetical protein
MENKEFKKRMQKLAGIIKENTNNQYTMYSGIVSDTWESVWKNKNFKDRVTNVTNDIDFAVDYSYNFKTGKYEDMVVEISNIPLEAFVAYREDEYKDDEDFNSMEELSNNEKQNIINSYSLFLVNLYPYKNQIITKLIQK